MTDTTEDGPARPVAADPHHLDFEGRTYHLSRIPDEHHFEFELTFGYLLAPALSVVVGGAVEAFATEAMALLRDFVEPGEVHEGEEPFDLARLVPLFTGGVESFDPRLRALFDVLGERLPAVLGPVGARAVPELTDRAVDHAKVKRLCELAILGRVTVTMNGKPGKITSWNTLSQLSGRQPRLKYALLAAQWKLHWAREETSP
jgi:hypothetical protein